MAREYWLTQTKHAMERNGDGSTWLPGSTTWRHYMPQYTEDGTRRHIADAIRKGYLTEYTGIPQLTAKGYREL